MALHVRLHADRWHDLHLVAGLADLTVPVVLACARFIAIWQLGCDASKPDTFPRVDFLGIATDPSGPAPWSLKPCFAKSMPIMWTCSISLHLQGGKLCDQPLCEVTGRARPSHRLPSQHLTNTPIAEDRILVRQADSPNSV